MTYPYKQNSYFPGGEVLRYQRTVACTTAAAAGAATNINLPPGERVVDMMVQGVASISALDIKVYAYTEETQSKTQAQVLDLLVIGSTTSATVLTQATSSVAPATMCRVLPFDASLGIDGVQCPFGLYISMLVSSVTTTTGSAVMQMSASPRS